ncbi:hypothetical protein HRI_001188200 [Hibiscus trionum]|uniref:Retrotransposon gag domain-containing protein n=1 Tax=Hibiscus trionum TaxID=183268 RepID=A0A9W7HCY1_HIBTR|nr:hypothetical protein HRI_001188200 [Hibiscus trionum]
MANNTGNVSDSETSQVTQNVNQAPSHGDVNSSLIITNHRLDGKNFFTVVPISTHGDLRPWEIRSHISRTYLLFKTAKEMWDAVKENYSDLGNASQVFEIKLKLKDIQQGTLEVTQYYNLKILCQELDMYYEVDWGEGLEHTKFMSHLNKERLYEFLAGLNRDLDEVRGRILGRTPLPTIGEAFAEVRREENRHRVMMGDFKEPKFWTSSGHRPTESSALVSRGPQSQKNRVGNDSGQSRSGDRVWCSYCNRTGHTKEKCFKLHGYPGTTKIQKENKALLSLCNSSTATPAPAEVVQDVRLTKSQLETLHKLLGAPISHCSLAIQGTEIGEDDWHC